ncbi:MAG: response regulator [Verrucomicrobiota bacterium]
MNILLIEDELSLAESAIAQMTNRGHNVLYAKDLSSANSILEREHPGIKLILADHNLPDGMGIDFVIAMKDAYPDVNSAIVSGCLTEKDTERLDLLNIPYFRKPLLYGKVLDHMRRLRAEKAASRPSFPAEGKSEES